jgi:nucleoid-associated protein YgaU
MSARALAVRGVITDSNARGADRMPDVHSMFGGTGLPLASLAGAMSKTASSDTAAAQSVFSATCRPGQILAKVSGRNARRCAVYTPPTKAERNSAGIEDRRVELVCAVRVHPEEALRLVFVGIRVRLGIVQHRPRRDF